VPDEQAIDVRGRPDRLLGTWEFARFIAVGTSGYALNLITFSLLLHFAGVHYRVAATGAFLVALANNFFWHRHWTFQAKTGRPGGQAARFVVVCVAAFGFDLLALSLLVDVAGLPKVASQAIAIAVAAPLSFLGNKYWTFAVSDRDGGPAATTPAP
jgi:putative flippase GtrA